jgi:uncharacterized protein YndB with AHSA1/START domain
MSSDRIEKKILLRASHERVWRAISDSREFGNWFGVAFDGPFVARERLTGRIAPTKVDPKIAELQKPYAGFAFEIEVDRIEPMRRFSFRWHPYAIESGRDYSREPMTLVAFALEEAADGIMLTITESGFDRIPLDRRAKAFAANEGGWTHQTRLIEMYVSTQPET